MHSIENGYTINYMCTCMKYHSSTCIVLQREERRRRAKEMLKKHRIDALKIPSNLSSSSGPSSTKVAQSAISFVLVTKLLLSVHFHMQAEQIQRGGY